MNPSIHLKFEEDGIYKFTLSGVNVSIANAIRRTILSDIKTVCIDTDTCKFEINNTRLHNEILKERLNAIPVYSKDLEKLVKDYCLEVDVKNDTDNLIYLTTADFKIKNKETGNYITEENRNRIFPKNLLTDSYIDFARLGCHIDDTIEDERIKLTASFVVRTAKENGAYSVVSKCTYENTRDAEKAKEIWEELKKESINETTDESQIEFKKRDFYYLDAQRYFIPDSFDFTIESIGVFTNQELLTKACILLNNSFHDFLGDIETEKYTIQKSCYTEHHPSTIENSFDVILDKDYTFGKVLEYILYEKFFQEKHMLTYIGFKKFHPHDTYSILRIAFAEKVDVEDVRSKLIEASNIATTIFTKLHGYFKNK